MKKFKGAAIGFIAGALSMVTVTAFAAYSEVPATLLQIFLNGKRSDLVVRTAHNALFKP